VVLHHLLKSRREFSNLGYYPFRAGKATVAVISAPMGVNSSRASCQFAGVIWCNLKKKIEKTVARSKAAGFPSR
jgi:hypothetical protein